MEDLAVPEAGNFSRSKPEAVERKRVTKERALQGVRSRTAQNEKRNVLGRMAAAKTTGHNERDEEARFP